VRGRLRCANSVRVELRVRRFKRALETSDLATVLDAAADVPQLKLSDACGAGRRLLLIVIAVVVCRTPRERPPPI
jgi:hypothetical protein